MIDALLPFRLAQTTSELAFRNATSSMAMWADATQQAMNFWSGMAQSVGAPAAATAPARHKTTRSWYRQPDSIGAPAAMPYVPPLSPFSGMGAFAPILETMKAGAGAFMGPGAAFLSPTLPATAPWQGPFLAWLRLFPQPAGTPAWPMAYMLMASGMPQAAAWPTAEAGAHAIEASRKAAEGLEQMFASYRSDGGHALAQIVWPGRQLH